MQHRIKGFIVTGLIFTLCACISDTPSSRIGAETETEAKTKTDAPKLAKKRIALSYDDAPRGDGPVYDGAARAQALTDSLAKVKSGPVVFFVTPRSFPTPEGRARIAHYAAAGHLIANHSNTHPWASRIETAAYIADIDAAEQALVGFENRRAWYRFPFLDEGRPAEKRDAIRTALSERDLISGYVTVDTYDWHIQSRWDRAVKDGRSVDMAALGAVYVDLMMQAVRHYHNRGQDVLARAPAQILLLHENDLAADFSDELITALRAEGWEIISPDEAYADPIAQTLPRTTFSGMGRISALAYDAGRRGGDYFDHPAADEAAIDAVLAAKGVFGE